MSLSSWIDEYYTSASECKNNKEALEQGLRKFKGVRAEALKKHNVIHKGIYIEDKKKCFSFTGGYCGLCMLHYKESREDLPCKKCPIFIETEYVCDVAGSEYELFDRGDPEPMITLLEKLLEKEK